MPPEHSLAPRAQAPSRPVLHVPPESSPLQALASLTVVLVHWNAAVHVPSTCDPVQLATTSQVGG